MLPASWTGSHVDVAQREVLQERQSPAPATGRPWALAMLDGRPAAEVLADLAALRLEAYQPTIHRRYVVPKNRLSARQRGTRVIRTRAVPLLPGFLFVQASAWDVTDVAGILGVVPVAVPHQLVVTLRSHAGPGGTLSPDVPVRELLDIGEPAVCPVREPRFCHLLTAALGKPIGEVAGELLVKLIAYRAANQPG